MTFRRSKILGSLILIIIVTILGISVPLVAYTTTRASPIQLVPPGLPISETVFANLTSDELDSVVYRGDFTRNTTHQGFYSVSFRESPSSNLSEYYEVAQDFIDEILFSYIDPSPRYFNSSLGLPLVYLRFNGTGQSNPNGVLVGINPLSMKVVRYLPRFQDNLDVWPSELQLDPINEDNTPANETQIQFELFKFLKSKGYVLTETMRLFRVIPFPDAINTSSYEITIAYTKNSILPDDLYQGITVYMDAITGYIIDFEYRCMNLPEVDLKGLINPDILQESVLKDNGFLISSYTYSDTYLRLKHIGDGPNGSLRMQLAWSLEYSNHSLTPEPLEFYRDAYEGHRLNYSFSGYIFFGSLGIDANLVALLIPIGGFFTATLVYLVIRARRREP